MDSGKLIRRVSLISLILADIVALVTSYIGARQFDYIWLVFWGLVVINAVVIAWEIWGVTTGLKKTVSTRVKYWVQHSPVLPVIFILSFIWVFISLGVHWLVA